MASVTQLRFAHPRQRVVGIERPEPVACLNRSGMMLTMAEESARALAGVDRSEGFGERLLGTFDRPRSEMPPQLIAPLVAEVIAAIGGREVTVLLCRRGRRSRVRCPGGSFTNPFSISSPVVRAAAQARSHPLSAYTRPPASVDVGQVGGYAGIGLKGLWESGSPPWMRWTRI